jgi:hypothetical protein
VNDLGKIRGDEFQIGVDQPLKLALRITEISQFDLEQVARGNRLLALILVAPAQPQGLRGQGLVAARQNEMISRADGAPVSRLRWTRREASQLAPGQPGQEIRGASRESRLQLFKQILFRRTTHMPVELLNIEAGGRCTQFLGKAQWWLDCWIEP